MTNRVQLKTYDNSWYDPGRSILWRAAWLFAGQPLFSFFLLPSSALRVVLLRLFGAKVGSGVVIHSGVQVKYPWHLVVGNDCWIGENVWLDCLTTVQLGSDVCLSQGAYLCTGNHDWTDPSFGLLIRPVSLDDGAWAGAKCVLLPGTRLGKNAVVAAGGVASGDIPSGEIHGGNPASFLRVRRLREGAVHSTLKSEVRS